MEEVIKVILADDHAMVIEGMRSFLDKDPVLKIVGTAINGQAVLDLLESGIEADVVLTDIDMPVMNGNELARRLTEMNSPVKVIALTMHDDPHYVAQAFEAGAKGYLYKHSGMDEVIYALKHVREDGTFICRALSDTLIKGFLNKLKTSKPPETGEYSERELEILTLIADGYTNQEIADRLFTSRRTVEGHRLALISKTGVRNTAALIKYAIMHEMIRL